jgi:hypothetical protein
MPIRQHVSTYIDRRGWGKAGVLSIFEHEAFQNKEGKVEAQPSAILDA